MITFTIRPAAMDDRGGLAALLADTALFGAEELGAVVDVLDDALDGRTTNQRWSVATSDGELAAAAMVASEEFGDRVANLLFLGTFQRWRRRGAAAALVRAVAADESERGTRLLLVDTASSAALAPARAVYARHGFKPEASIRDFYGDGEDKVTFARRLG